MRLGMTELIIVLVIVMVLFGGSKLPQLGKGLGEGIRGFKKALNGDDEKPAAQATTTEQGGTKQA